nr:pyocin S6 family toxin immunity protein [Pseudomonas marvdashtae]
MKRKRNVHLEITGFFPEDHEDDFIQFELDVGSEFESAIMAILGWESLADEVVGELPLSDAQVRQIERAIQQTLPENLNLFIGVRP